ncbi:MAG TPA: hypothetical protein VKK79_16565 [Candidatus Lokiarchaeia archaeon]|nr:hypothetical protein [Candidatus Lokiarchaeia archaeon]
MAGDSPGDDVGQKITTARISSPPSATCSWSWKDYSGRRFQT